MWGRPWKRPLGYECELRYEINNKKRLERNPMNRINYGRIPMVFMYKDSLLSQNYIVTKIWIIQGYKKNQHAVTHEDRNSTHKWSIVTSAGPEKNSKQFLYWKFRKDLSKPSLGSLFNCQERFLLSKFPPLFSFCN